MRVIYGLGILFLPSIIFFNLKKKELEVQRYVYEVCMRRREIYRENVKQANESEKKTLDSTNLNSNL